MKKNLNKQMMLAALAGAALVCGLPAVAAATISGQCVNCHTMHNSQDGNTDLTGVGAQAVLLNNDCAGCHTADGATRLTAATAAPAVIVAADGNKPADAGGILPGGYMFLGTGAASNTMHNIPSVTGMPIESLDTPPGYVPAEGALLGLPNPWSLAADPLTCAGATGCHGDHNETTDGGAIRGGHHTATAIGFRLLAGINGAESPSYTTLNNKYAAVDGTGGTTSISYLCSQCHGAFHGNDTDTISGGAWIRHPSDLALSSATGTGDDYITYGTAGNPYAEEVPVGTTVADLTVNTADSANWPTNDGTGTGVMVLCISCHRAHGSDYADLLRWDYSTMTAGNDTVGEAGTGCFRCHTNKDG